MLISNYQMVLNLDLLISNWSIYNITSNTVYYVSGFLTPVPFFFPSFSLPDVLCNPTDLIRRKGIPFEMNIGHIAPSSGGFLVEVSLGFPQL